MVAIAKCRGDRHLDLLGDDRDFLVLRFECERLENRWKKAKAKGARFDYPEYKPHVSITRESGLPLESLVPWRGPIVLGGEIHSLVKENPMNKDEEPIYVPGSLYVNRPVLNGVEIREWFQMQGVPGVYDPHDFHVTIVYSRDPLTERMLPDNERIVVQ